MDDKKFKTNKKTSEQHLKLSSDLHIFMHTHTRQIDILYLLLPRMGPLQRNCRLSLTVRSLP